MCFGGGFVPHGGFCPQVQRAFLRVLEVTEANGAVIDWESEQEPAWFRAVSEHALEGSSLRPDGGWNRRDQLAIEDGSVGGGVPDEQDVAEAVAQVQEDMRMAELQEIDSSFVPYGEEQAVSATPIQVLPLADQATVDTSSSDQTMHGTPAQSPRADQALSGGSQQVELRVAVARARPSTGWVMVNGRWTRRGEARTYLVRTYV